MKNKLKQHLNDIKLREKFILVFIICVCIPLICTNSFIISIIQVNMKRESERNMEDAADRMEYQIYKNIESLVSVADYLYRNEGLNQFLKKEYTSVAEYYDAYVNFLDSDVIHYYYSAHSVYSIVVCTENDTIVNGNYFIRKSDVENADWVKAFEDSGRRLFLYAYYEDGEKSSGYIERGRHIAVIRRLDHFGGNDIMMLDIDYQQLVKSIAMENSGSRICLCENNNIILDTQELNGYEKDFQHSGLPSLPEDAFLERPIEVYGAKWKLWLNGAEDSFLDKAKNYMPQMIFLYILNCIIPSFYIYFLYRSMHERVSVTQEYLGRVKEGEYGEIPFLPGKDEIGSMMVSYNVMALKIKELVEVVFKNREREKNLEISRKQAELNALQSQINPHFMFNALESIRMHSILKKETETARILEDFAILMRKNIQWSRDFVTVEEECDNVSRYLEIQKYRFGERLEFSVSVQKECRDRMILKFIIITFVENACVHGIEESLEGGSITVLVSEDDKKLYLEIMDSGNGMPIEELEELKKRVESADISDIQNAKKSIGILNAVVRMRQHYGSEVQIEINSTIGEGTEVCICLPKDEPEGWSDVV